MFFWVPGNPTPIIGGILTPIFCKIHVVDVVKYIGYSTPTFRDNRKQITPKGNNEDVVMN